MRSSPSRNVVSCLCRPAWPRRAPTARLPGGCASWRRLHGAAGGGGASGPLSAAAAHGAPFLTLFSQAKLAASGKLAGEKKQKFSFSALEAPKPTGGVAAPAAPAGPPFNPLDLLPKIPNPFASEEEKAAAAKAAAAKPKAEDRGNFGPTLLLLFSPLLVPAALSAQTTVRVGGQLVEGLSDGSIPLPFLGAPEEEVPVKGKKPLPKK